MEKLFPNADLGEVSGLSYDQLSTLFDSKFGNLRGSELIGAEEYDSFKEWSIKSGLFAFQVQKYGWDKVACFS